MNINLDLLVEKLRGVPLYRESFEKIFGGDVTAERIARALGEFEKSIVSAPAPFDKWVLGDDAALSPEAVAGLDVFFGKGRCAECHEGPHFGATRFESMGLLPNVKIRKDTRKATSLRYFARSLGRSVPVGEEDDWGRAFVTGKPEDMGKFLVPSLRQLAHTAPYGHDGRFPTLRSVIDLTAAGGDQAAHRSDKLKPVELSEEEKKALEAFLLALTGDDPVIKPPHLPE
jgi:cytochrome c peroxidase